VIGPFSPGVMLAGAGILAVRTNDAASRHAGER
jgi:hypothetical protein